MSIAYETNTDLAFDTEVMRECGKEYARLGQELAEMVAELDALIQELAASGWTTGAGRQFQLMADTNWKENMDKYVDLLEALDEILQSAAQQYDNLYSEHIENAIPYIV